MNENLSDYKKMLGEKYDISIHVNENYYLNEGIIYK